MHRFFADERGIVENIAYLNAEDAGHALRVLRLENGDEVELVCAPARYLAEIDSTEDGEVRLRVTEKLRDTEAQTRVTLYQGLPKADKMEFIVQKAVELGVSRIVPYLSKNCVSRPDKTEKKVERWRKIAAEAAKQCGRGRLPEVAAVVPVAQAIAQAAESETALFFYENERRTGLRDALAGGVRDTVSLMVGPEGGFDPAEAKAAVDAGLQSVSLGTRILRCETAPIAALAAVLYAGGNM